MVNNTNTQGITMTYRGIVRTLVVSSILPVGGERAYVVYAYDSQGTCYVYQTVLGSSTTAAKVADAALEQHIADLPWDAWYIYTSDPLAD